MALFPDPKTKPLNGSAGQFQNMEEWNAFTAFASAPVGFGLPVSVSGQAGDGTAQVKLLATGEVFAGITRENITTSTVGDSLTYAIGDQLAVADEGVIFVPVAGAVTKGQKPFFNPTNQRFYGASAAGYLPIPNAEFDQGGAAGTVVPLRLRVVPGGAAVTAAT